ncbi:MAG TPA: neutral/alkaline non-lysosomal ceramidase N-terminal domain-containing protein, partial [Solirubrobacteraceae bacterium]|nr:neutral/alkaline non-lysosomal ceramidase N-terminal domain-containing protein [Solirubrobacteraceae bacterium]
MRKGAVAALLCAALTGMSGATAHAGQVRVGVGVADATWHVGASAGQYASTRADTFHIDPHVHQVKNAPSYGVQSRLEMRAIVVEEVGGERFALVKTDLYIPQDLLFRRAAQLLAGTGIDRTNLVMSVSHNHSSPYYTSTAWGAWAFQDVFDIRAYDYYARAIAEAVREAAGDMRDVRVGASATYFDKTHRNAMGPTLADDGTPAGYPNSYTDHDLTVVRFDDESNGKPLAVLVNYSLHPEGNDGNDLISADYVGPLERMIDRATGATTIFTQNAVGAAEPERSSYHHYRERQEFTHREYSSGEFAAKQMADAVIDTFGDIAAGTPDERYADRYVAPFDSGRVDFTDAWFPGPLTHPYPAVSNCRTNKNFNNVTDPQLPIVGLPDCAGPSRAFDEIGFDYPIPPQSAGVTQEQLKEAGIPVPDNYGAPSFTGLEENVDVHLQAFRIGDILFTVCSCEQWADQSYNIKSRTDKVAGNETAPGTPNLGFDWSERCTRNPDGTWTCPHPQRECAPRPGAEGTFECWTATITISDERYRRMEAQVNNDAHGWNSPEFAPWAESEPPEIERIKGNFTHDDNQHSAALGYRMTVPISMANDYNGYIASYREFQRGDHYRKALTGWGPHSSDYMATRLVKLGRLMKNPELKVDRTVRGAPTRNGVADPDADGQVYIAKTVADVQQNDVRAAAIGETGSALVRAYEATLPDDGGPPRVEREPRDVQRFDLTSMEWVGGSNYTDNPVVRVQRREGDRWVQAADMTGEVVTTIAWPDGSTEPGAPLAYRLGGMEWRWTAHFEPFVSRFDMPGSPRATPPGTYRMLVDGFHRSGRATRPYHLRSREFRVGEWAGVEVQDMRLEADGRVSFEVGPRRRDVIHYNQSENPGDPVEVPVELGPIDYPDSYARTRPEAAEFIRETRRYSRDPTAPGDASRFELYCIECSFRPWIDVGDAAQAVVTFVSTSTVRRVAAQRSGDRWITSAALGAGEAAYVCPGHLEDAWGNFNGDLSPAVGAGEVQVKCVPKTIVGTTPRTTGTAPATVADAGGDGPGGIGPGETGQRSSLGLPPATPRRSRSIRVRLR